MISRRGFLQGLSGAVASALAKNTVAASSAGTIDVKALGAFGDGKLPDLRQLREAVRIAGERRGGATIFFPPGNYYLGGIGDSALLVARGLENVRFLGDRATISCRSAYGQSDMLQLAGCRNITIEGLKFRDHGFKREIDWLGAAAIRLANDGRVGCDNIDIKNCEFDSVLSAVVCRRPDDLSDRTRCRNIRLTDLRVARSYYGFNFQDNGDNVTGRGLRCSDVRRSYFPYGVSNHDIEIEAVNNATGYADVLIKCYHNDTVGIKVKVKSRGKRGGDAIVILDQQHERGRGTIRTVNLDLDVDDADCLLNAVVLIRSLDAKGRPERQTQSRWDDITIDGDVRACIRTSLIEIGTTSSTPGRMRIGPRLAKHPRLPKSFRGFMVDGI